MHPEIENLINMALADGEVTEKERAIILRKAESLGIDKDEVEMILEGRIAQTKNQNIKPAKEKVGNIKICPSCGAHVEALTLNCSDCGHEFSERKANSTIVLFQKKIEDERKKYFENKSGTNELIAERLFLKESLPNIIRTFPIPNTKEDLFEMLSFMSGKVMSSTFSDEQNVTTAYQARVFEIISKLKLINIKDTNILSQINDIKKAMEKVTKKAESTNSIAMIISLIIFCAFFYAIYAFFIK